MIKVKSPALLALGFSLLLYCFDFFIAIYELGSYYTAQDGDGFGDFLSAAMLFCLRWVVAYFGVIAILFSLES